MNKVRKIVAHFLRIEPDEIHGSTKIDYKSFSSSLMLHRMYAKLANEGYIVQDPSVVVTFDDLLSQLSLFNVGELTGTAAGLTTSSPEIDNTDNSHVYGTLEVGVDTEIIENFDFPEDVRNDTFYKNTFSPKEIDYALQRVNPRATFTALFSLKESIVKADNTLIGRPFNEIEISHTLQGKPFRAGFSLSVSHSDLHVVSIAIKTGR
jgi:phosphopantetheine--protein transferase-like protein